MAVEDLYHGPDFSEEPKPLAPVYGSAVNQALGFGVPAEQLTPEVGEDQPTSEDDPRALTA